MTYQKNSAIFSFPLLLIIALAFLLRVPFLDRYPPSLYSDEVSQGYNAYSILKTGKDEYGTFLPVALRSFGDWKPPLQTYLMIPTISIFGLNAWGVRLPSALLGTATVGIVYLLTIEIITMFSLGKDKILERKKWIGLATAFLIAISPWHILFSRSALEANIGLFFVSGGILCFLYGFKTKWWFFVSSIMLALSLYSYHNVRLIVPFLLVLFCIVWYKKSLRDMGTVIAAVCVGIVILLPLFIAIGNNPNILFGRSKYVSVFYDQGVSIGQWNLTTKDGDLNSKMVQFLHNKPYLYGREIIRRALQHVDMHYLGFIGDHHVPFQIPGMGLLYFTDLILFVVGLKVLLKKNKRLLLLLLGFMMISIVPSAMTFLTPAANRAYIMILPLLMICSIGLVFVWENRSIYTKIGCICLFLLQFLYFTYQFSVVLPTMHANWWQYGNKELMTYLKTQESRYSAIYISEHIAQPQIYLLFYQHIDPIVAQKGVVRNLVPDAVGFEHAKSFGNYFFYGDNFHPEALTSKSLLVTTTYDLFSVTGQKLFEFKYPNGEIAYQVYETN